jgi:hypothetical protein
MFSREVRELEILGPKKITIVQSSLPRFPDSALVLARFQFLPRHPSPSLIINSGKDPAAIANPNPYTSTFFITQHPPSKGRMLC